MNADPQPWLHSRRVILRSPWCPTRTREESWGAGTRRCYLCCCCYIRPPLTSDHAEQSWPLLRSRQTCPPILNLDVLPPHPHPSYSSPWWPSRSPGRSCWKMSCPGRRSDWCWGCWRWMMLMSLLGTSWSRPATSRDFSPQHLSRKRIFENNNNNNNYFLLAKAQ